MRRAIIVKDHRLGRPLAGPTFRIMDWVGNRPHGVTEASGYRSDERWRHTWQELGLRVDHYQTRLLYPPLARWLFEAGLHFLARLTPIPRADR